MKEKQPLLTKSYLRNLSVVFLFFIIGCTTTKLSPKPISEKLLNHNLENNAPLILDIETEQSQSSLNVGYQFILCILPFGKIEIERPYTIIFNKTYQKLILAGYAPISSEESLLDNKTAQKLRIKIKKIELSAYDFLFMRKITAEVQLEANLLKINHDIEYKWTLNGYAIAWKEFGFTPQLNYVLHQAIDSAVDSLIKKLAL